jgi:predicted metal-dependent phosphoesterase TrpH
MVNSLFNGQMKTRFFSKVAIGVFCVQIALAHEPVTRARTPVNIPDVPGYVTLKCDFHIHTIFSDGNVWPTVRAEEAWREGLDAIAITDHIEYQPHKADVNTNHNRSYEIARGTGNDLDVLVVKGSEITQKMPPGHLNAIFLTNSMPLSPGDWREKLRVAHEQGAFIFWNHPGWGPQLTDNKVVWHDEHTWLVEQGYLNGIEVVNGRDYYPEAHRWAIDKKLTMFSNSDIHAPLNLDYHVHAGDHRPLTLVFAKERSQNAIKEALFARRTVVYSGDKLIGEEQFLKPIFEGSVKFTTNTITTTGKARVFLQLANSSDITYELERIGEPAEVTTPKFVRLAGGKTVLFEVKPKADATLGTKQIAPRYKVTNLLVGPDKPLTVTLPFEVILGGGSEGKN